MLEQAMDVQNENKAKMDYSEIFNGGKRFVFDIDGVIALKANGTDYSTALPNDTMIRIVNELYERGNNIVLFTARGYVTGIDWRETTERQMADWGLKFHELHFGKPNADYYVDDRMLSIDKLQKLFANTLR